MFRVAEIKDGYSKFIAFEQIGKQYLFVAKKEKHLYFGLRWKRYDENSLEQYLDGFDFDKITIVEGIDLLFNILNLDIEEISESLERKIRIMKGSPGTEEVVETLEKFIMFLGGVHDGERNENEN